MSAPPTFQSYLDQNRQLQKWAWLSSLVPLVIFVAIAIYSLKLQQDIRAKQDQLTQMDTAIEADKKTLIDLEQQLKITSRELKVSNATIGNLATSPEQGVSAYRKAASQFPDVNAVISIQVAYDSEVQEAKDISAHLRKPGYGVAPDETIEVRGKNAISQYNYLRYFHEEDQKLASQVLRQITAMGVKAELFPLYDAPDVGEAVRGQFEFRLGSKNVPPGGGLIKDPPRVN